MEGGYVHTLWVGVPSEVHELEPPTEEPEAKSAERRSSLIQARCWKRDIDKFFLNKALP